MKEYAKSRRLRLNYKFDISGNPLSRIILRFAIPKTIQFQQELLDIKFEHEPEIIFLENGNRFAQLHLKNINNHITSSISMYSFAEWASLTSPGPNRTAGISA